VKEKNNLFSIIEPLIYEMKKECSFQVSEMKSGNFIKLLSSSRLYIFKSIIKETEKLRD